jgi:hypothetical protein
MPVYHGADNLLSLCEWAGASDPRNKHVVAGGGILSPTSQTLAQAGYVPVTITSGYMYSGETVSTNLFANGSRVVLPKIGCRPGKRQQLYRFTNTSYSEIVKYINSFPDGEMWVSDTSGARTGTKVSKKLADWNSSENLPCGMLYSVCCLVGAGGGGGAAGLLVGYDNNGGSGGVSLFLSQWLRLSVVDAVTVVLGGMGKGGSGIAAAGTAGGDSYVAGRAQVTGGGFAKGGSNNAPSQTSTVSYPWGTYYQNTILSSNGSDTSATSSVSATFPSPEGGTVTSTNRWGGAAGSGAGYGAAGDGNPSSLTIWY